MFTADTFWWTCVLVVALIIWVIAVAGRIFRQQQPMVTAAEFSFRAQRAHDLSFDTHLLFTRYARECLATALGMIVLEEDDPMFLRGKTFQDVRCCEGDPMRQKEFLTDVDVWDVYLGEKLFDREDV